MCYKNLDKKDLLELEEENRALQARILELEKEVNCLGEYISQCCCSRLEAAKRIGEEQQRWQELMYILNDIYDVMQKSKGVAGWHLNDNIAIWDEFKFTDQMEKVLKFPWKINSKVMEYMEKIEKENQKLRIQIATLTRKKNSRLTMLN